LPAGASAQAWNGDSALALARRAIERRARAASDTALRDYKARLTDFSSSRQFGEAHRAAATRESGSAGAGSVLEGAAVSKQRIIGWRDRAELPTDINYHRDHSHRAEQFGSAIRLGEATRCATCRIRWERAASMSMTLRWVITTIVLPQRAVRVAALRVRPKNFASAAIVGTLFVDLESAELVRMAFNFTPKSYLDARSKTSASSGHALWRPVLAPYRQELEIRRRATWLDIPARGIIRGRWKSTATCQPRPGGQLVRGEEITALPKAERDSSVARR